MNQSNVPSSQPTVTVSDPAITPPSVVLFDPKYYWVFALILGLPPLLTMSNENAVRLQGADGKVMSRVAVFFFLYVGLLALVLWDCWRVVRGAVSGAIMAGYDVNKITQMANGNAAAPLFTVMDFPVLQFLTEPVVLYLIGNLFLAVIFMSLSHGHEKTLVEKHIAKSTTIVRPALTVFVVGILWDVMLLGGLLLFIFMIREYNIVHQANFHRWPI